MSRLALWVAIGALCQPVLGCVYDPDERCGPHEVTLDNDRCSCEEGYVPGTKGCVPCPENEREQNGACICAEGFARVADADPCTPLPSGLGAACDDATPCTPGGRYSLCQGSSDGSGYCTSTCITSDDCEGGYKCHPQGDTGYCRRPPTGYAQSCKSDDDCAGNEASYCEQLSQHVCLVPCSAGHSDVCFEGETCCDFVLFAPICVPESACSSNGGRPLQ